MINRKTTGFIHRLVAIDVSNYKLLFNALLVGVVTGLLSSVFRLILARLAMLRTTFQIGEIDQAWQNWV